MARRILAEPPPKMTVVKRFEPLEGLAPPIRLRGPPTTVRRPTPQYVIGASPGVTADAVRRLTGGQLPAGIRGRQRRPVTGETRLALRAGEQPPSAGPTRNSINQEYMTSYTAETSPSRHLATRRANLIAD